MEANNIRTPHVDCASGNDDFVPGENPNFGLSIRFPFFDKKFIPDSGGKFIDCYERSGLTKPHSLDDYTQYNFVFSSFRDSFVLRMVPGDSEFWEYLMQKPSEEMVFLDVNFDASNLCRLIDVLKWRLPQNKLKVTVFTAKGDSANSIIMRKRELGKMIETLPYDAEIQVLVLQKDNAMIVHDRFALVDDRIWHFGAAIGGMHDKLHAYTGPWNDVDSAFKTLTDDLRKGATSIL